jgi:hypothetical protein
LATVGVHFGGVVTAGLVVVDGEGAVAGFEDDEQAASVLASSTIPRARVPRVIQTSM